MQRVLVCAATRAEHDACRRGILGSEPIPRVAHELLVTGVGPERAARALAERLRRGVLPDLVVSSGFAGSLGPSLPIATWVTGTRIEEWDGMRRVPLAGVALVEGPAGLVRCDVVSSRVLLTRAALPHDVEEELPVVVDMESAALARAATQRGIAIAVLRLISDTPAHPLPSFLSPFTAALSETHPRARLAHAACGIGQAVASPRRVLQLVREGSAWLGALEQGWRQYALWSEA